FQLLSPRWRLPTVRDTAKLFRGRGDRQRVVQQLGTVRQPQPLWWRTSGLQRRRTAKLFRRGLRRPHRRLLLWRWQLAAAVATESAHHAPARTQQRLLRRRLGRFVWRSTYLFGSGRILR